MRQRTLRLLVVNWQDLENPAAGGAEVHLHEIFGRLAARGHRVTLLCSGWPGAQERAEVGGLEVHRVGGRHSFAIRAAPYYRRCWNERNFDLVVEDINKIPLYTPLWVRAPVVGLVPHLFGSTAYREAPLPLATVVWLAERPIPLLYRGVYFQVISRSTGEDLQRRGVRRDRIRVIPPGLDHERFRPNPDVGRFATPTFAYVGRLKRYKGIERAIDAVGRLNEQGLQTRLLIVGKGDHAPALRDYAERHAASAVEFRGYVTEEEKVELLRRVWATVYPSPKEGWGLTNVEAAACGTPAVASDSPGLRESVADGKSGILVPHGDVSAWAEALGRIARDAELRDRLSAGAREFSRRFGWDRAANETESHLLETMYRGGRIVNAQEA